MSDSLKRRVAGLRMKRNVKFRRSCVVKRKRCGLRAKEEEARRSATRKLVAEKKNNVCRLEVEEAGESPKSDLSWNTKL